MDSNRPSTPSGSAGGGSGRHLYTNAQLQPNPLLGSPTTPRRTKKKIIYSDRYIPSRAGVDLQAAFTLGHRHESSLTGSTRTSVPIVGGSTGTSSEMDTTTDGEPDSLKAQEANATFDAVLKSELFGDVANASTGTAMDNTSGLLGSCRTGPTGIFTASSQQATPPGSVRGEGSPPRDADIVGVSSLSVLSRTPRQARNLFTYQSPSKSRPSSSSLTVDNELYSLSPVGPGSERILLSPQKKPRSIPKVPYRVLDAPELADDFYLNLVDWGSQDILGVGLGSCVYLWDASTGSVNRLCDLGPGDSITSLSWIGAGTHLAVGTNSGLVEIWDASTCKCTRTMTGHASRASSLAWNRHILTSGSRDRTILHRDVREPAHYMKRLEFHKQEVCGLRWNVDENKLASGGNDNKLFVWDGVEDEPLYRFTEHQAAVKAIAWSPHQRGILASGGGTADRRIKVWNTITGLKVHDVDTGSQVCNLAWSKTSNELVSTHGYSRNQIVIWKYSTMQQVASLTGHTYRVLYLAMSPDGQTIVTGAGDETLRFWNVFEKSINDNGPSSVLLDAFTQLR